MWIVEFEYHTATSSGHANIFVDESVPQDQAWPVAWNAVAQSRVGWPPVTHVTNLSVVHDVEHEACGTHMKRVGQLCHVCNPGRIVKV